MLGLGTYAALRYFVPEGNPAYKAIQNLFDQIQWKEKPKRADAIRNRFNAFTSLLWAVTKDSNNIVHTDLNKASHNIKKWPINYDAISQTVDVLKTMGWLQQAGKRTKNRQLRYQAPEGSPMLGMQPFEVKELPWSPPVLEIRLGDTDLEKAPTDVELMSNPKQKAWINKYLLPPIEDLNKELSYHHFVLFPYGQEEEIAAVYRRIYTNIPQDSGAPYFTHGRIYPKLFSMPSKKKGWRQKTLIDDKPTTEVDVHASSLRLLSEDYLFGFDLPETDDLYTYGQLSGLKRELTKTVIQAVINGVELKDRQSWPRSFKENKDTAKLIIGEDWNTYSQALLETYPSMREVRERIGLDLMLHESDIIIGAMNYLLDKDIGCLSIHDCLIVPEENVDDAQDAFCAAYQKKGFKKPKLSVGW